MKIQVLSDLHLEDGGYLPEHHREAAVIVLAGDLAPYTAQTARTCIYGHLEEHSANA